MTSEGVRPDPAFQRLDREYRYRGRIASVSADRIRLPGGHEATYEIVHLPSAVAVVPILEEGPEPEVVLIEQFRASLEGYIHEIPAGILEPGEDPAACAARELAEETGYEARSIRHLVTVFPTPGTSDHRMHFYLAEGLTRGEQRLEPGECLSVKPVKLAELVRWLLEPPTPGASGQRPVIVDAKTHIGVLHAHLRRAKTGG